MCAICASASAARRDVLVGRQRAATGKRLVQDRNGSSVSRCAGHMPRLGLSRCRQPLFHEIGANIVAEMAVRRSIFQRCPQRRARKNHVRGKRYISPNRYWSDKPLLIVDHAEPKRHIVHAALNRSYCWRINARKTILIFADDDGSCAFASSARRRWAR
jgi:hypothetical protein